MIVMDVGPKLLMTPKQSKGKTKSFSSAFLQTMYAFDLVLNELAGTNGKEGRSLLHVLLSLK